MEDKLIQTISQHADRSNLLKSLIQIFCKQIGFYLTKETSSINTVQKKSAQIILQYGCDGITDIEIFFNSYKQLIVRWLELKKTELETTKNEIYLPMRLFLKNYPNIAKSQTQLKLLAERLETTRQNETSLMKLNDFDFVRVDKPNPISNKKLTDNSLPLISPTAATNSTQLTVNTYIPIIDTYEGQLESFRLTANSTLTLIRNLIQQQVEHINKFIKFAENMMNFHHNYLKFVKSTLSIIEENELYDFRVFGVGLNEHLKAENTNISNIITDCALYLIHFGLDESGLFFSSPGSLIVKKIANTINAGYSVPLRFIDSPKTIAALLKNYLSTIPDSLIRPDIFNQIGQLNLSNQPSSTQFEEIKQTIAAMDAISFDNIKIVLLLLNRYLRNADANRTDSDQLALIFTPLLYKPEHPNGISVKVRNFLQHLIENFDDYFNCSDMLESTSLRYFDFDLVDTAPVNSNSNLTLTESNSNLQLVDSSYYPQVVVDSNQLITTENSNLQLEDSIFIPSIVENKISIEVEKIDETCQKPPYFAINYSAYQSKNNEIP